MMIFEKIRVFGAVALLTAFIAGFFTNESSAWAFSCSGNVCVCGSLDLNPTNGQPVLPEGDWGEDCNNLAAYCDRIHCDYEPNLFGGGTCSCD